MNLLCIDKNKLLFFNKNMERRRMLMSTKIISKGIQIFVALLFLAMATVSTADIPDKLDSFTRCLKARGAVFYGTFWCPYCKNQKEMFGESQRLLPYIECANNGQTFNVCRKEKIRAFPTWKFADGSRFEGELSLETLAEKTGCKLPRSS